MELAGLPGKRFDGSKKIGPLDGSSRELYRDRGSDKNYGEAGTQLCRKMCKRGPNDRGMNFIGAIRNEIDAGRDYRDAFRGK